MERYFKVVKSGMRTLGELLVEAGALTARQFEDALNKAGESGKRLSRIIAEERYVSEQVLMETLQEQLDLGFIDLDSYEPDPVAAAAVPEELARRHHVIPVGREGRRLILAMADPTDRIAIEDVSIVAAAEVEPVIASERALGDAPVSYTHLDVYKRQDLAGPAIEPASKIIARGFVFKTVFGGRRLQHFQTFVNLFGPGSVPGNNGNFIH